MIVNSLQNNLEELRSKHPNYAGLVADAESILMWFKILAKDTRRSCDQRCTQLVCDPQEFLPCNYYDWKHNKCILEMLLHE